MELQRPMHHRVVLIALPLSKKPGEEHMQTFIMAQGPDPQVIQSADRDQNQDDAEKQGFAGQEGQRFEQRAVKPGWLLRGFEHGSTCVHGICGGYIKPSKLASRDRLAAHSLIKVDPAGLPADHIRPGCRSPAAAGSYRGYLL